MVTNMHNDDYTDANHDNDVIADNDNDHYNNCSIMIMVFSKS